jgi:polyribonucleotide nucleotidyltransferase
MVRTSAALLCVLWRLASDCRVNAFLVPITSSRAVRTWRIRETASDEPATVADSVPASVTPVTPEGPAFSLETDLSGPGDGPVHRLIFHHLPGQASDVPSVVMEVGKIGRQAAGSVTLTRGDSVLLATAARDDKPKEGIDFLPLSVEHQERFSSAGLTSGSYNKRDGRPAEHEVLTCRLIDRPLRPLIRSGWSHETQILSWVLSYDGIRSCDPLAILTSSAAVYLSDIPLEKAVAAVQVGTDEQGNFILHPTNAQMEKSTLHLTVAGTVDAVLMVEGAADFLPEDQMIAAVQFGHEAIQVLCQGLAALYDALGIQKKLDTLRPPPEGIQEKIDELYTEKVDAMYSQGGKKNEAGQVMGNLQKNMVEEMEELFPGEVVAVKGAFKDLLCRRMYVLARETGTRADGRDLAKIRRLDMEAGFLPRVHGSALFTRGETQAVATVTLGDASMRQKIDRIAGSEAKRFYLQYTFPPSSVGETGRVGMPGRREVGHGNLAERALAPVIPSELDFPYSIRVESLITESHGSSSMASVCGGSLALMDAGVPIKSPVAGIAMGMLLDEKKGVSDADAIILSDITGTEDALGTMDFKVAGDREGITTFQLDIKCEGLTVATMARALEQARQGRMHLLDEMDKIIAAPRVTLPDTVPKMTSFEIAFESIGKVIGPGGKQIRSIIEDFELEGMDVRDDGKIQLSSFKEEKLTEAKEFVLALVVPKRGGPSGGGKDRPKYEGPEAVEGENYTGKITGIHAFGVFVEILPGAEDGSTPGLEGLVHVSELARERVRNCEGFMRSMDVEELKVKYLGKERGKVKLSRKAVLEESYGGNASAAPSPAPVPSMSSEEVDVIAQAIEGVKDL